jgi:hypothetical protein
MTDRGPLPSFLMDMDGVLVHEDHPIRGAGRFIKALQAARLAGRSGLGAWGTRIDKVLSL